jgi:hypothetical protein
LTGVNKFKEIKKTQLSCPKTNFFENLSRIPDIHFNNLIFYLSKGTNIKFLAINNYPRMIKPQAFCSLILKKPKLIIDPIPYAKPS